MDRKTKGRLAEAKVVSYLIENKYDVFLPFSDNSKCDLIAMLDGSVYRFSVKYTSDRSESGKWKVALRQVSRRANNTIQVDKFDKKNYDYLAVYIGPIDTVVIIDVANIDNTTQLNIAA